jgi:O-antigen/teichoic acid export membrane protein
MSDQPAAPRSRASYSKALGFNLASFASAALLAVGSSVAVARLYGARTLGEFALASAPAMMLNYLSTVQEQAALVRELAQLEPRAPRVTGLFAAVLTFSTGLTLLVTVPFVIVSYFVFHSGLHHASLFVPSVVLILIYLLLRNPCWNCDTVLSAFRAGRELFLVRTVEALAYLAAVVCFAVVLRSVWGIVAATGAMTGVALLARLIMIRRFMRYRVPFGEIRGGFKTLPVLIKWGLKASPTSLFEGIGNQTPIWALGALASPAALGAFTRARNLGGRTIDLLHRILEMLLPTLVERHSSGDRVGYERAYVETVRYSAVAFGAIAAVGGGAARGIMSAFGPDFTQASWALAAILLSLPFGAFSTIQAGALWSRNRPAVVSVIYGVALVVNVVLTVVLIAAFGVTGAGVALVAATVIEIPLTYWFAGSSLVRVTSLWPRRQIAGLGGAYLGSFLIAYAVDNALADAAGALLAIAAGGVSFALLAFVLRVVQPRDLDRLRGALRSVPRRRVLQPS